MTQRQLHRARVIRVAFKQVTESAHLLRSGRANKDVAVLALNLSCPEVLSEVPADVSEEISGRVVPHEVNAVVDCVR